MCPTVIIDLIAAIFLHDGHWFPTFRAKHPGTKQRLYPPTLLTPATASLPEIFVGYHPLFLSDEGWNIECYLFTIRLWPNERSLYTQSQITQGFLRVGNTTVCIIFSLSRVAPSPGYLDYSLRSPGRPIVWPNPKLVQFAGNPVGSATLVSDPDENLNNHPSRASVDWLAIRSQFVYLPPSTEHFCSASSRLDNLVGGEGIINGIVLTQ
ncbi:MAG: hypothetical protein OEV52_02650 [Dehalococcoidia bacterium]|nr:hypothetical protein [Dehalococcoidia bacterium]